MIKKIKFPKPLVLLLGCIATAALATYALSSGMFEICRKDIRDSRWFGLVAIYIGLSVNL